MRITPLCFLLAIPLLSGCGGSSAHPGTGGSDGGGPDGGHGVPFAAGSPWPKFRGNAAQDARSAVKPSQTGGHLWTFPTG
jgi:hypothetical protein